MGAIQQQLLAQKIASGSTPPNPDYVWWKCDAGSGTVLADSSTGAGAAATLSSSSMWSSPGASGSGSSLIGNLTTFCFQTGSTVSLGATNKIITVSMWVNCSSWSAASPGVILESSPVYFSNPGSFVVFSDGSSLLNVGMSGTTSGVWAGTTPCPSASTWHNLVIVFNMNTPAITMWIDGSTVTVTNTTNTFSGATGFSTQKMNGLARNNGASLPSLTGLDDVRVWNGDQSSFAAYLFANPN